MPTAGGTVREMNCNNSSMNSWHSWSPNSKWLVFASKERGAYTQLYLTHIDENGNDTPPVLIENFCLPERAINIPEFVNISTEEWVGLIDGFSDSSNYALRVGLYASYYGEYDKAIKAYTEAIQKNPEGFEAYFHRGTAKFKSGKLAKALEDFIKVIQLKLMIKPSR